MTAHPIAASHPLRPIVVLDTNVVLDLWFFADPRVAILRDAMERSQLDWVITPAIHDELVHVLFSINTSIVKRVSTNKERALKAVDRWAQSHGVLAPRVQTGLRCTDPDDQKFIDLALHLALHLAPAWLLSRDRAVLKLARRAAGRGVRIATPEQWTAATIGVP